MTKYICGVCNESNMHHNTAIPKHCCWGCSVENNECQECGATVKETVESIIEEIGKGMCQITLVYPNAGMWNITLESHNWTVSEPTLLMAFKKAKSVIDFGISTLQ